MPQSSPGAERWPDQVGFTSPRLITLIQCTILGTSSRDFVPSCGVASSAGQCVGQSDGVVTFEYRVFIERGGGELVVMHYVADKVWPRCDVHGEQAGYRASRNERRRRACRESPDR
jgi:hypothetical protein